MTGHELAQGAQGAELAEPRLLIDGRLVESSGEAVFPNVDPATEVTLGHTFDASAEDIDRAVTAARRAFDETNWATDRAFRRRCLLQLQDALEKNRELLRSVLVAEVGTPVSLTHGLQLETPVGENLKWPVQAMNEFPWERDLADNDSRGVTSWRKVYKEPVGVVGAIVPWNFPFETTLNKLGMALATGNTVVLKPAAQTPWNATHLGRLIAEETDIPAGVVNIVPTSDNSLAERIVDDPRVDMISFTGSTRVGRRIQERVAPMTKKLLLELGGKSAHIVLDDADFDTALAASGLTSCLHAGQGCALLSRVLLPRSRYAEGLEIIEGAFRAVPYGDPADPANIQGPQISADQRDTVEKYIRIGQEEGARLVLGGGRPAHLPTGYYVEPTLFADVTPGMRIEQEEIFGPVLAVLSYDDEEDAIRIADNSPYGLSGAVSSASPERALAVARRIRTGSVSINGGSFHGADAPYGGYKGSGLARQGGFEGFEAHLETKLIAGV
ncbi:aldehyde dehydrogenase family protein [Streptomyces sp. GQFP]|uniref:aldehyde dehydrogenase family protein n=1 Tax=Streptomyces sp. GQFP TaxID=2907545 RepID=UPI001F1CE554|nr:aldehyde dehydrogenase family protein [Streptomyces sp. GQFP]UIX29148.1 aldehyde dehydrogenase family protein [Streptomyces sp. GQFP]